MRFIGILAGAALLCGAAAAPAAPVGWQPVDEAVLAEARGGFDVGGGLVLSLGIERVASINGSVVSSGALDIPDVSRLNAEQAGRAGAALSALTLLQNGAGNRFAAAMPSTLGATVIQNSLNDQVLATRTVINASVNSLDFFKAINFQDGLRTALSDAIGVR
ncbi:MAG: hypothetical protein H7Z39_00355 [Burkholderiaceae bacterium]|nr:hypothetical protein [Burkholderiaceae bacterium]